MKLGQLQQLSCGPFKGVYSTVDPFDADPAYLTDALNGFLPDTVAGSGWFQRPAFTKGSGATHSARASALFHYTATSGTEYNFFATNGKLYRVDSAGLETDVTPAAVTIDSGLTTRCYMAQLNDQLIFTDGVNKPWRGTALGASPITGTYIQADGAATAWTAFGAPFIQAGCVGFVLGATSSLGTLVPRLAILWSEPNQPDVGYIQSGYTDWWNLIQTSQRPITRVLGRNDGLIVWRDQGIGFIAGQLSGSFSSSTTNQLISDDIGLLAAATVGRYQNHTFFADQFGRPQHLNGLHLVGSAEGEVPMWAQMRQYIESQTAAAGYATAVTNVAIGVVEPNLNLYLCAPFASSSLGVNNIPPTVIYAFDAKSGTYVGRWQVSTGCAINGIGVQLDANGAQQLWVTAESSAASGLYANWMFQRLSAAVWSDSVAAQTVSVTTDRLGYQAGIVWDAGETMNVVTMNAAAVAVAVQTPYTASTTEGTPTPATSQDGTYRCVVGMDVHAARGISVTLTPTLGSTQWGVERVEFPAVPSKAGFEDA